MGAIGYFNGEIGELKNLKIPLCDRSVFFGDAVYDAVLVLNRCPFALDLHLDRLYNSCRLTEIVFSMPRDTLKSEIGRLLAEADVGETMLYLQVTRGVAPRKHEYPRDATANLIMYVSPIAVPPRDKRASLIRMEDLRFKYCNIKTTNLLPNVFAAQRATAVGATEVLFHRGDRVTEAAHSSILMLKNSVLVLPPLDELILPGITRAIVKQLCEENGIPSEERVFSVDELLNADEILLCSTTKNVLRVFEVDGQPQGGKDEALAMRIQNIFLDEVYKQTGVRV